MYSRPDENTTIDSQLEMKTLTHKEEGGNRKDLDLHDREKLLGELRKHSRPLTSESKVLYNVVNGQHAPPEVNVQNAVDIGQKQAQEFANKLPGGFHSSIKKQVKTMQQMKKAVLVKGKPVYDMEALFARLLIVGQQRDIDLPDIFQYELSPVPPSLIDEFGCLRKGDKSILAKRLGVTDPNPSEPNVVLVDGNQLLYHIVWPVSGKIGDVVENIKTRLGHLYNRAEVFVIFDQYEKVSAKDHERQRRAGEGSVEYNIELNTVLPGREAIMKNSANKQKLCKLLCTFDLGQNVHMVSRFDALAKHDEADITLVSYVLEAAKGGAKCIRVLCDDTDVFVLLVYWTWYSKIAAKIQMEKWDKTVWDINATVNTLDDKCRFLLAVHALSGCDTVSFPCGKGKVSAINVLLKNDLSGMEKLGERETTQGELVEIAKMFFFLLYAQRDATTMKEARYNFFKKRKKPPCLKYLPPTDQNLLLHVLRAHLQVMLWKSADKARPPDITSDITKYGWEITNNGSVMPVTSTQPVAPPKLLEVVSCSCKAEGSACSKNQCNCKGDSISCTEYCNCEGGDTCHNPFTNRENDDEDDGGAQEEDDV